MGHSELGEGGTGWRGGDWVTLEDNLRDNTSHPYLAGKKWEDHQELAIEDVVEFEG